jgi:uncharacterized membrane protein
MSPTTQIVLLWLAFAGSHLTLSSVGVRGRLVARIGEGPFRGLYSLIALALFIPLVTTYFRHKHDGPALWMLPHTTALLWTMYVGMGVAFVLVVAGFIRPSPAAVIPGDTTPRGVYLITRHPLMMGLALFGLMHLLPNGSAADVAFFGGFGVFALIGAAHQDRRKLATDPSFRRFYEATPFLPFTGPKTLEGVRQLLPAVAGTGIVAMIAVRYFHAAWFGG